MFFPPPISIKSQMDIAKLFSLVLQKLVPRTILRLYK